MRKIALALCSAFILSACQDSSTGSGGTSDDTAVKPAASLSLNAITLNDGNMLTFDGRIVRYDLRRNDRGSFDRYTVESPVSHVELERALFWELSARGYERRERRKESDRYVVNYVLKGQPDATLTADYSRVDEHGARARLVLTRKALEL